jgi:hypothetical protein
MTIIRKQQIITKASAKDASMTLPGERLGRKLAYFLRNQYDTDAAVTLGSSMSCQMYTRSLPARSRFCRIKLRVSLISSGDDVIRIEAQGTNITAKLNGVTIFGPSTDSGIASGKPGFDAGNNPSSGSIIFDNFAAGDFTTVSSSKPLLRPATMQFRGSSGALLMGRIAARIYPAVINTGSIGALSGSAIATAVVSGAVTGKGAVVGAVVARATPAGTLTGTGAIAGASAARAVVAGTGTTLNPISGATVATALSAGTVTGKAALVGAANAAAIATGALAGKGALSGASVVTVIASGATTGKGALSGQAIGTAITTGTVSSAAANLAGAAVCTAIASGAVTGKGALTGQAICRQLLRARRQLPPVQFRAQQHAGRGQRCTVSGVGALAGSTNATATASGALQAKGALAGSSVVTVQTIGFVANIPTPNISGSASLSVDVSALIHRRATSPKNSADRRSVIIRRRGSGGRISQQQQHVIGHGAFTLPGNSMAGRGAIEFRGRGAFDLLPFTHNGQAEQSFGGVGEFELDHMGIRMWSQVENKVYARH